MSGIIRNLVKSLIRHYYTAVVAAPQSRVWYHNLYQQLEDTGEVPNLANCKGRPGDEKASSQQVVMA